MFQIDANLQERLKSRQVRMESPDGDTLFLRDVPVARAHFNKDATNLLIKRPAAQMPFIVCVDADLEYQGGDESLSRAFRAGHVQHGWRIIAVRHHSGAMIAAVVEEALGIVGFEDREPLLRESAPCTNTVTPAWDGGLIRTHGVNLTNVACAGGLGITSGREERVEAIAACLMQRYAKFGLLVGESGTGKTSLIHAVARWFCGRQPTVSLVQVDLGHLMAGTLFDSERESLLLALFNDTRRAGNVFLVLEHAELAVAGLPRGPLLLGRAIDEGLRILGTTLPQYVHHFVEPPLSSRVQSIAVAETGLDETERILDAVVDEVSEHHCVRIDAGILAEVVEVAAELPGRFPGKAVALLDAACARAAVAGETELSSYYVRLALDSTGCGVS